MATMKRKARRFDGEEGSYVDPLEAANSSEESQALMDQAKGEEILKRMRDEESAPKEMPKRRMAETPTPRAKTLPDVLKATPKSTTVEKTVVKNENYGNEGRSRPAPAPAKKEMYRDISGKMRERSADVDTGISDTIGRGLKSFGSGVADYFGSLAKGREKYREKPAKGYAKGGSVSSASKRADGIAQKGKTRGKMC